MTFDSRRLAHAAAASALCVATLAPACAPDEPPPAGGGPGETVLVSLLAVGDTGDRHALPALREGQRSVARGLAIEDRRRPADALVLLGDNFYPDGLRSDEMVERIRENLALPYCRFSALSGSRSREVADACPEAERRKPAPPIFAVLGNHDYDVPESPELQKRAIPEFVSNWHMPPDLAEVHELGHGLSLVLIDSIRVRREEREEAVREAIRRARGPWRVIAGHYPLAREGDQVAPADSIGVEGAPVHVFLAGHLHNLQIIEGQPPEPALHVVAGGGSTIHELKVDFPDRRFALEQTGFARLDLVRGPQGERLVASLYAMPRYPIEFWARPRLVARWAVARDGALEQLFPPPTGDQP